MHTVPRKKYDLDPINTRNIDILHTSIYGGMEISARSSENIFKSKIRGSHSPTANWSVNLQFKWVRFWWDKIACASNISFLSGLYMAIAIMILNSYWCRVRFLFVPEEIHLFSRFIWWCPWKWKVSRVVLRSVRQLEIGEIVSFTCVYVCIFERVIFTAFQADS